MVEEITKKEDELCGFAPYLTRSRPGWGLSLSRGGISATTPQPGCPLLSPAPPHPPPQRSRRPQRKKDSPQQKQRISLGGINS